MPKFTVDVKAFINITVEAPNAEEAALEAERLVESCDPTPGFINGWNASRGANRPEVKVLDAGGFDIDGVSDVANG